MLSENELFSKIDDCSICPFNPDNKNKYGSDYCCNGNPDNYLPCTRMDEFGDCTIEEVVAYVNMVQTERYTYYAQLDDEQRKQKEKNKEIANKRRTTNLKNRDINTNIKLCKNRIRARITKINFITSLVTTGMIMRNQVVDFKTFTTPDIEILKEENRKDNQLLESLIKERTKRNRERREKNG